MKPPVAHQPVQPPQGRPPYSPADADAVRPADEVAADDGRDVRVQSTEGGRPGLVGDFGPVVDAPLPDFDFDPQPECERRRH